ncbi:hypothetical protein [Aquimarina longa]|uniref:hypothetical protein n=1 Tax=Aquimarina longa TaxID=1080221 RepID=UPI00078541D2|nr:hypothetical protein [Aquimarina longa]
MTNRALKDIRLYESETENISGQNLPSELGSILNPTENTNFIAQRIARKLNELKYSYGEVDHIYINLTTFLRENEIKISSRNIDKRIKYIDYGISTSHFNSLKIEDKDKFIENKILKILKFISNRNNEDLVNQVALALSKYGREIKIYFKTKETKSYRIVIYYQIAPFGKLSNVIIEYYDKKNDVTHSKNFELKFYEDIYSLIGDIGVKDNKIILKAKKSYSAGLVTKNYKTPIELELI